MKMNLRWKKRGGGRGRRRGGGEERGEEDEEEEEEGKKGTQEGYRRITLLGLHASVRYLGSGILI